MTTKMKLKQSFCSGLLALTCLSYAGGANACVYDVDYDKSIITFSGTHAGNAFSGVFGKWQGDIWFNSNHLDQTHLKATFDLSSAKTGNSMYDGTLPTPDWFDVKNHPEALYYSTMISKADKPYTYKANGYLSMRGKEVPLTFDFTINGEEKDPVTAKAVFLINRKAFELGQKSDPRNEWVSEDITVTMEMVFKHKGACEHRP